MCLVVALLAYFLGIKVPLVGGPVFAILIGLTIANIWQIPLNYKPGIAWCGKRVLQVAIIIIGGSLGLRQVVAAGRDSLAVMLLTLICGLVIAWILGKALRVGRVLTVLIGVGTAICGGSAIAAVAPIVKAEDDDIAFSISTIFLFNIVAVFTFPALGHLLGLGMHEFGIWAGTAVNDTSSVLATAFVYGQEAGNVATITKLARTTMIVPIALILTVLVSRSQAAQKCNWVQIFPWFILGFLFMSMINSTGIIPGMAPFCVQAGKFLITLALAGIGLNADLKKMLKTGWRPVLLGFLCWISVAISSLLVQGVL